jgi:hypothetical protein
MCPSLSCGCDCQRTEKGDAMVWYARTRSTTPAHLPTSPTARSSCDSISLPTTLSKETINYAEALEVRKWYTHERERQWDTHGNLDVVAALSVQSAGQSILFVDGAIVRPAICRMDSPVDEFIPVRGDQVEEVGDQRAGSGHTGCPVLAVIPLGDPCPIRIQENRVGRWFADSVVKE